MSPYPLEDTSNMRLAINEMEYKRVSRKVQNANQENTYLKSV